MSDNEADLSQPTVSANPDELSDNESLRAPPIRRSILSVGEPQTERPIELARCAPSEEILAKLSRGSHASSRTSEYFAGSGEVYSKNALGHATDLSVFPSGLNNAPNHNLHAQKSARKFYDE